MGNVKYVTLSPVQRAWWDDLYHLDPRWNGIDPIQVLETSYDPQPTGLLDVRGNELFRPDRKAPDRLSRP